MNPNVFFDFYYFIDQCARQKSFTGNVRGNSFLFQEQAQQIKQEPSSNGADNDVEFLGENSPDGSNLRKIRNALMAFDSNMNLKVESDEGLFSFHRHTPENPTQNSNLGAAGGN